MTQTSKQLQILLSFVLLLGVAVGDADARGPRGPRKPSINPAKPKLLSATTGRGEHRVSHYVRKNGTCVMPHYRSGPRDPVTYDLKPRKLPRAGTMPRSPR